MKLFNFKKFEKLKIKKKKDNIVDPYIIIGNIIKERRAKKNLSVEDLSSLSKIPTSTILGIENNVKELIPPYPFIRSILLKKIGLKKIYLLKIYHSYQKYLHLQFLE